MKVLLKLLCLLLVLGILGAAWGCRQAEKVAVPVLHLGHAPHDHHAPLYIAAMNPEYFREHGGIYLREKVFRKEYELVDGDRVLARVLIDSNSCGNDLVRRLAEGIQDMSYGSVLAMLRSIDGGSRFTIVAPVMTGGAGLVVQSSLPVASWQDFLAYVRQGKRPVKIGYKMAVFAHNLLFEEALQTAGITFSKDPRDTSVQVVLVDLFAAKNFIPAMENGLVDGFIAKQPYVALAEENGLGRVVSLLDDLPPAGRWRISPCCALAASDAYVAANPEIVQAMVTLSLRATSLLNGEPQKSAEQIARWLDTTAAAERKSLRTMRFLQDYDQTWQQGMDVWVNDMIRSGMLQGRVKEEHAEGRLDELIYNREFFDKAKKNL